VALNSVVEELKHSVVRVVRASTADVDRRAQQRYQVNLPCRLTAGAFGAHSVRVIDISLGGAAVIGAPDLPVGTRGKLEVDRIEMPITFAVRSTADSMTHLAFELDAMDKSNLARMLDQAGFRRAA
jgi:hypothetical protein